jgi:hypothetical protein
MHTDRQFENQARIPQCGHVMIEMLTVASAPTTPRARDARGRFVSRAGSVPSARRVRTLAARDSRGRFVAFPTTQAPSWYVFCADGYRIPGEPQAGAQPAIAPAAPHERPCATVPERRPRFARTELQSALLVLLLIVVSAWYGFHLPPPHR